MCADNDEEEDSYKQLFGENAPEDFYKQEDEEDSYKQLFGENASNDFILCQTRCSVDPSSFRESSEIPKEIEFIDLYEEKEPEKEEHENLIDLTNDCIHDETDSDRITKINTKKTSELNCVSKEIQRINEEDNTSSTSDSFASELSENQIMNMPQNKILSLEKAEITISPENIIDLTDDFLQDETDLERIRNIDTINTSELNFVSRKMLRKNENDNTSSASDSLVSELSESQIMKMPQNRRLSSIHNHSFRNKGNNSTFWIHGVGNVFTSRFWGSTNKSNR